jgi:N-acetylglucosamine-6-phosphate deacetylase
VEYVDIPLDEAIKLCSVYPAIVMQHKNITGKIEINKKANLLCLSAELAILNKVINH